jgi:hypothetical protein
VIAIGPLVGLPASTVHAVLIRHGLHRLAWLDQPTGQPIRRYERAQPGELLHVDVKKLGRLRDGGGWRIHGRDSWQERRTKTERGAGRRVGFDPAFSPMGTRSLTRRPASGNEARGRPPGLMSSTRPSRWTTPGA